MTRLRRTMIASSVLAVCALTMGQMAQAAVIQEARINFGGGTLPSSYNQWTASIGDASPGPFDLALVNTDTIATGWTLEVGRVTVGQTNFNSGGSNPLSAPAEFADVDPAAISTTNVIGPGGGVFMSITGLVLCHI